MLRRRACPKSQVPSFPLARPLPPLHPQKKAPASPKHPTSKVHANPTRPSVRPELLGLEVLPRDRRRPSLFVVPTAAPASIVLPAWDPLQLRLQERRRRLNTTDPSAFVAQTRFRVLSCRRCRVVCCRPPPATNRQPASARPSSPPAPPTAAAPSERRTD